MEFWKRNKGKQVIIDIKDEAVTALRTIGGITQIPTKYINLLL